MEFVLYSRAGCHLCDEMLAELAPLLEGRAVAVRVVDVDGNRELKRRYGLRIPVLTVDGDEICSARLVPERIRALLRAAD